MTFGKLTIIVGLPGAGKSIKVQEIRPSLTGLCIDDFHANAIDNDSAVKKSRHYRDLIEALRAGHDCVIADIAFCEPNRRKSLEDTIHSDVPKVLMKWIFFENSPEKCERNCRLRNRETLYADLASLKEFASKYVVPDGVITIPIWQQS